MNSASNLGKCDANLPASTLIAGRSRSTDLERVPGSSPPQGAEDAPPPHSLSVQHFGQGSDPRPPQEPCQQALCQACCWVPMCSLTSGPLHPALSGNILPELLWEDEGQTHPGPCGAGGLMGGQHRRLGQRHEARRGSSCASRDEVPSPGELGAPRRWTACTGQERPRWVCPRPRQS